MKHLSKDNMRSIIMLVCFLAVVLFMAIMNTSCSSPTPRSRTSRSQVEFMKADSANHAVSMALEDIWSISIEAYKGDSLVYFNQRTIAGNNKASEVLMAEELGVAQYLSPDSISKSIRKLEIE